MNDLSFRVVSNDCFSGGDRLQLECCNATDDINLTTKRSGIRVHSALTAFFLKCFGKIEEFNYQGAIYYLNKGSVDAWKARNPASSIELAFSKLFDSLVKQEVKKAADIAYYIGKTSDALFTYVNNKLIPGFDPRKHVSATMQNKLAIINIINNVSDTFSKDRWKTTVEIGNRPLYVLIPIQHLKNPTDKDIILNCFLSKDAALAAQKNLKQRVIVKEYVTDMASILITSVAEVHNQPGSYWDELTKAIKENVKCYLGNTREEIDRTELEEAILTHIVKDKLHIFEGLDIAVFVNKSIQSITMFNGLQGVELPK